MKINDRIKITCEPFEGEEWGTVVSVDGVGINTNKANKSQLIAPGSGDQELMVVILRMSDESLQSLVAIEEDNDEIETWDWRFPSKAPSDVKIQVFDDPIVGMYIDRGEI